MTDPHILQVTRDWAMITMGMAVAFFWATFMIAVVSGNLSSLMGLYTTMFSLLCVWLIIHHHRG